MSGENAAGRAGAQPEMPRSRPSGPHGVLWSGATARYIVNDLMADVASGLMTPTEATELIARVWARAAPMAQPRAPRQADRPRTRHLDQPRHRRA